MMIYFFLYTSLVYAGHVFATSGDGCFPNPCANKAVCTPVGWDEYHCACPKDLPIGGKNCDQLLTNPNPEVPQGNCRTYPCQNGGYCYHDHHSIYYCECAKHYWGKFCENAHPCIQIPQLCNAGKCVALDNNLFHCHCPSGSNGTLCEHKLPGSVIIEEG
ncbi:unnamed protein product [Adineta steineri]|uniref:EGF-like domain-containing protein n=1 Tax=Adineta steineri TaxID=433720 RepID=A0A814KXP9_9BILA|nr:unnamed protein product [Adineta steineri]CAF1042331.1 unnamed protein product [Adineta steineri]CAF1058191.1 unnamed protein product [Adineta steineri]CAF3767439.1 unnamed protein product [Adineta steineri]CAF4054968.1 unnamed protein product [Adineta steineri]